MGWAARVGVALLATAVGCGGEEPSALSFRFVWEDASVAPQVDLVEVDIVRGGCDSEDVVYTAVVGRDGEAMRPPELPPGEYSFRGTAVGTCAELAAGCQTLQLPQRDDHLEVILRGPPRARCAAELCVDGECVEGDAGADASEDAADAAQDATNDAPDSDAAMDAGDDAAMDAGDDATMDAGDDAAIDAPVDAPVDAPPDAEAPCTVRPCASYEVDAYLKATNTGSHDHFGESVALSGDGQILAIGVPYDDSPASGVDGAEGDGLSNSGAVFVFRRAEGGWLRDAYLKASNPGGSDRFGFAVSLSDDGSLLAVGAPWEDGGGRVVDAPSDDARGDAGAVYLFRRTRGVWAQEAYVKSVFADGGDRFGYSVSLSDDGTLLAVGAPYEDGGATTIDGLHNNTENDSGAVFLFRHGASWAHESYVKAANRDANDAFGWSVALSGDASTLVVGAPYEDTGTSGVDPPSSESRTNSGAAYVFRRTTTWGLAAFLKASVAESYDQLGGSVDVDRTGSLVVVGAHGEDGGGRVVNAPHDNAQSAAGAAYAYVATGAMPRYAFDAYFKAANAQGSDLFGEALALSASGDLLLVGATGEDSASTVLDGDPLNGDASRAGAAYLFRRLGGVWAQELYLKAPNAGGSDYFGHSVAISADGATMVCGALYEDSAATTIDGDGANNTASNAGAAYVIQASP